MMIETYWHDSTFYMYFLIIIATFFFSGLACRKNANGQGYNVNKLCLFIPFAIWVVVLAVRSLYNGTDTYGYWLRFKDTIHSISVGEVWNSAVENMANAEPGYSMMRFLLRIVAEGFSVEANKIIWNGANALLWAYFLYKSILSDSKKNGVVLSVAVAFVMFFFRGFSMLRQSIAVALVMYGYTFLLNEKKKSFFVCVAIAVTIHYTAIISLVAYYLYRDSGKNWTFFSILKKLALCAGFVVFFMYGDKLLATLFQSAEKETYTNLGSRRQAFGIGHIAKNLPICVIYFAFRKQLIEDNPKNEFYILLAYINLVVSQFNYINPSFNRLSLYFQIHIIFTSQSFYRIMVKKWDKSIVSLLSFFGIMAYMLYTINYYIYTNPYYIMPYFTLWGLP